MVFYIFTDNFTELASDSIAAPNNLSDANVDTSMSGIFPPNIALLSAYDQSAIEKPNKKQATGILFHFQL